MACAAVALSAALLAPSAGAVTLKPTRFDDPPVDVCSPTNCSLREALVDAFQIDGREVIKLRRGTYELSLEEEPGPMSFLGGGLDIPDVRIEGEGSTKTRIDANGIDRVLELGAEPNPVPQKVRLTGLTLKGGDPGAAGSGPGGGIYNEATFLTLIDVVVRGNDAAMGGGIHHRGSFLTLRRSSVRGNNAGEGGGIHTISQAGSPEIDIDESTISGNLATKGGGILADGAAVFGPQDPEVEVVNSTIAGNEASAEGGGVMADNGAFVELDNTTVAYNGADEDNAGGGVGGGIHQHTGAVLRLGDSVIAANTVGSSGSGPDCSATETFTNVDGGNVLTAGPSDCPGITPADNQFVGSALIGPLAANGGLTKTVALQPLSPALGYANTCPAKDQRGESRNNNCDSGSYERKGP